MKIFCVGLNKTGTRSLNDAFEILGLRSLHWGGNDAKEALVRGPQIRAGVERALAEGRPLLHYIEEADAYSDILPLSVNFELLDRQYPGSKFIFTTRDRAGWIESRRRHVETNLERRARGEYNGSFVDIDEEGWSAEWEAHEARVRAYFEGRPDDLLVIDIGADDGWDVLCPFLGLPVPDVAFPRRR